MSLGGFGRGWRRPDHRIFYSSYDKTPLGCHWQWRQPSTLPAWIHVQSASELAQLLKRSQNLASRWLEVKKHRTGAAAPWREALHPQRTRIWTRTAQGPSDAKAVAWFHRSPERRQAANEERDPCNLKHTILAGQMNQVGLIWNRLLPLLGPGDTAPNASRALAANPLARPVPAAMARAVARPGTARQQGRATQDSVSIAAHEGAYLESLVLHPLPADARAEDRQLHASFVAEMNRGAGAHFTPLAWAD
jgi:CRISPR-associated protein Cmr6